MTNYPPNYQQYPQQPPPRGGMPGWLKALLIIGIILLVGCGGCATGCYLLAQKGMNEAGKIGKQIHEELEKERKAAEARMRELGTMPNIDPSGATPAQLPADVTIQRGFTRTMSTAGDEPGSGVVMLKGTGTTVGAADFYRKDLTRKGWKIESDTVVAGVQSQTYSKNDNLVGIAVSPDTTDGDVVVTINYSKKPEP